MGVWAEVPAFLLGLITLVVTTNAFARRPTRRLRELRARADLLALLPEGPGRLELAKHLDEAVHDLVRHWEAPRAPRRPAATILVAVALLAGLVWIGGASTAVVWDDRPDWVRNLSLTGLVVAAACTAIMAVLNDRQSGHRAHVEED